MEIYMHREIGKRGSLDMIRDIVMINEEGEEKEEKDVKKRKRKPDDSGKKKRPPQRTPLKYFLTGSGCTIMVFSIGILVCRELPYIMRWLSGYMEDLGFIGVMLMMAIFGFVIIMLADEISYLMKKNFYLALMILTTRSTTRFMTASKILNVILAITAFMTEFMIKANVTADVSIDMAAGAAVRTSVSRSLRS